MRFTERAALIIELATYPETITLSSLFASPHWRGHHVEGSELVHAEDDFGFAVLGYDLAVGDGVEVLDAGLLGRVVRIAGGLPRLQALKGDAFLAE